MEATSHLTGSRLSTLPKRNHYQFIQAYAQEQRSLLPHYAPLPQTTSAFAPTTLTKVDLAFSTPFLEPRVTALRPSPEAGQNSRGNCQSSVTRPVPPKVKTIPKKLGSAQATKRRAEEVSMTEDPDEKENRLAERRQRKRAKRGVVEPAKERDTEPSTGNNEMRELVKKRTKVPPGFALIHGFSATNVGKHRLTLDPPHLRNNGVFKKGKASEKTNITDHHKVDNPGRSNFMESFFLARAPKKPNRAVSGPSTVTPKSPSLSSSQSSKEPQVRSETSAIKPDKGKADASRPVAEISSPGSHRRGRDKEGSNAHCLPYNPADSVVWDIEKGSDVRGSSDIASDSRQGTVVIPFPRLSHKSGESLHNHVIAMESTECASALSIGPSQSASQVPLLWVAANSPKEPATASRYFAEPVVQKEHSIFSSMNLQPKLEGTVREAKDLPDLPAHFNSLDENPALSYSPDLTGLLCEGVNTPLPLPQSDTGFLGCPFLGEELSQPYLAGMLSPINSRFDDDRISDLLLDASCLGYESDWVPEDCLDFPHLAPVEDITTRYDENDSEGEPWNPMEIPFEHTCVGVAIQDTVLSEGGFRHEGSDIDHSESVLGDLCPTLSPTLQEEHIIDFEYPQTWDNQNPSQGTRTPSLVQVVDHGADTDGLGIPCHLFYQGRSLLYGISLNDSIPQLSNVANAEADVAKRLTKNHWLPHRL